MLAAVAGRTRRVELGTAVLLPALRNPVLLAHQVATLDQAISVAVQAENDELVSQLRGIAGTISTFSRRAGDAEAASTLPHRHSGRAPFGDHRGRLGDESRAG